MKQILAQVSLGLSLQICRVYMNTLCIVTTSQKHVHHHNFLTRPNGWGNDFIVKDHDLMAKESYTILGLRLLFQWVLFSPASMNTATNLYWLPLKKTAVVYMLLCVELQQ